MNKAFEWIAGITAAVVIALLVWVGSSLVDLKVETGKLSVQVTPIQSQVRDLSNEVQELRGEVKQVKAQVADIQLKQQQAINR